MHQRLLRRVCTVLLATALVSAALIVAPSARAAEGPIPDGFADHKVTLGVFDPGSPHGKTRFEYRAFYPSNLQVHRGDVVWFDRQGSHSVSFFPGGVRESRVFVRDDTPEQTLVDMGPSRTDCAIYDDLTKTPCVLTGDDELLNSGVSFTPNAGARILFDADPGTYTYFCVLHPNLEGTIEVVPDTQPVPSPAQVEADRQAQAAADTAAGEALIAGYQPKAPTITDDGTVRWTQELGAATDDGRVAVIRFLPERLDIAPGDEVEFVVDDHLSEIHTATFIPRDIAEEYGFGSYLHFSCETDEHEDGLPGIRTGVAAAFTGCPPGTTVETTLQPWAVRQPFKAPGNQVVGQVPFHDTGILINPGDDCTEACDPWTGERFPDRGDAAFPVEGTFDVFCMVHAPEGMVGSIVVADPSA